MVAGDVEVLVADHIDQQKCLDAFQRSIAVPFGGQVAAAVQRIGSGPLLDRLFTIEKNKPNAISVQRVSRRMFPTSTSRPLVEAPSLAPT